MLNPPAFANGESYIQKLQLHFYGLAFNPLIVFVSVYFPVHRQTYEAPYGPMPAVVWQAVGVGSLALIIIGMVQFYSKVKISRNQETLREKLESFYLLYIQMGFLMWLGNMNAVLFFAMAGQMPFAAVYIVALIMMGMHSPTIYTLKRKLRLSNEEFQAIAQNQPIS